MKVLGLISSPSDPASRFRIMQYEPLLKEQGIEVMPRYYKPYRDADPSGWMKQLQRLSGINEWRTSNTLKLLARLPLLIQQHRYDLIWQNRLLLPYHTLFERKYTTPLCFDMDDAVWLNEGETQLGKVLEKSSLVFAGNEYLADFALKKNKNTFIVHTPVDTDLFKPSTERSATDTPFTLGWIGSAGNLKYLEQIRPVLLEFLRKYKSTRLIIVSSVMPAGFPFDNERILFREWDATNEPGIVQSFSAGLMPLEDTPYTRGKCSFKMLQYMACGVPVVVSPVGMNKMLLEKKDIGLGAQTAADWMNAFEKLLHAPGYCQVAGANGRLITEEEFALKEYANVVAEHFKKIC